MRSRIWRKKRNERAEEVRDRIWCDKQTCVNHLSVWQKEWMNGRWAWSGRGGQQMKWKIKVRVSSKGRLTRANPTGHHWSGDVQHYIWARTVAWMKGIMSEWSLGHHHACPYELWGLASHSWGSGLGVLGTLLLFGLLVQQCVWICGPTSGLFPTCVCTSVTDMCLYSWTSEHHYLKIRFAKYTG